MHTTSRSRTRFPHALLALLVATACGKDIVDPVTRASIEVDRTTVSFSVSEGGPDPAPATVAVANGGEDALVALRTSVGYEAGQPGGWLQATLSAATAPAMMTLDVAAAGLAAGTYQASVTLSAEGAANSPTVSVTLSVSPSPAGASIALSNVSFELFDFTGGPGATAEAVVTNGGTGDLTGLAADVAYASGQPTGWLTADLDGTSAPTLVRLRAEAGTLEPGRYEATVHLSSPDAANGPQDIAVSLEVAPPGPSIGLSSDLIGFNKASGGADPADRVVEVTNLGSGELTGLAASVAYEPGQQSGWLSAHLDATTAPAKLTLSVDAPALQVGQYQAVVLVASPVANNGSRRIDVTLAVDDRLPDLTVAGPFSVTPSSVNAGQEANVPAVTFRNEGPGYTPSFQYGFYLSADPGITADDVLLGSGTISGLAAGAEHETIAGSLTIPAATTQGSYYLGVLADLANAVTEEDETDNYASAPINVLAAPEYSLTVMQSPVRAGSVRPDPDQATYAPGTVVTLTATPAVGYRFAGWSGDAAGTSNPLRVTMDRDRSITANYALNEPVLTGTAGSSGVELSWTFEWPCDNPFPGGGCLASSLDHYEIEESNTSATSGFDVMLVTNTTRASPAEYAFDRAPGTYYYRVRAFGRSWTSGYSNVVAVTVARGAPAAPTGLEASASGAVVTLTWTDNAGDEDGFTVHASTSSSFSSYESFDVAPNRTSTQLTDDAPPQTHYFRVLAYNENGVSAPSNTVTATTAAPTLARFINESGYAVISLEIDGVQQFTQAPMGLLAGDWYQVELTPGTHTFFMANGFWDGSSRFTMYTYAGEVTVVAGRTTEIRFEDPPLALILSGFAESQAWDGWYYDQNGLPHIATFVFHDDGSYELLDDGSRVGSGVVNLLGRYPGGFYIEFEAGGYVGSLFETFGYFGMSNGPPSWPTIQYYPR